MSAVIVDLCAGAGGWEEGLRRLGHGEEVLGVDNDPFACATARAAGHQRLEADAYDVDPARFGPVTGLIASTPCPSFSSAGGSSQERGLTDPRGRLALLALRWALTLLPDWLAWEQVPRIRRLWAGYARILTGHGYRGRILLVDAADYGVPQRRRRVILLAARGRLPRPPRRTHGPGRARHRSIGEACGWPDAADWRINTGQYWRASNRESAQVTTGDQPAPTITTRSISQWQITPADGPTRHLTLDEAAAVQGFTPGYPFTGHAAALAWQVGNAVPPPLGAAALREVVA